MRILIVSDIHANLEAFRAVLKDSAGEWDRVWNLGDIVGYGPDPSACIELLDSLRHFSIMGNHDLMASGAASPSIRLDDFNHHARSAILWTMDTIKADEKAFLAALPLTKTKESFTLVHGSPKNPVWEYIFTPDDALEAFETIKTSHCLTGHTHCSLAFSINRESNEIESSHTESGVPFSLAERPWLLNPGSVGFPRDSGLRMRDISPFAPPNETAYALLDTKIMEWMFCRTSYNSRVTIKKMEKAGLLFP